MVGVDYGLVSFVGLVSELFQLGYFVGMCFWV